MIRVLITLLLRVICLISDRFSDLSEVERNPLEQHLP
jgi:hypothetical protein